MIITKTKPIDEILDILKETKSVFLLGCAQCATLCKTGGEDEVAAMKELLTKKGKKVTGTDVLDPACSIIKVKKFLHKNKDILLKTDAILVMACGNGVQSVIDGTGGKIAFPALDTLFLGEFERGGQFLQKCILCGECIIDKTGGICPITICAKGLLNGPCGGSKNGKCETDRERDCGWALIYKRLKDTGSVDNMRSIVKPQDYSKQLKPQKLIIK